MKKNVSRGKKRIVLVAVLKDVRDRRLLLEEKWYRIPENFLPAQPFSYIAFYQPVAFGREGKRIEYFARVSGRAWAKRVELLPEEPNHPRAQDEYLKISFRKIRKLEKPIRNIIPRRISFGFTDLPHILGARDILELYGVPPTEVIVRKHLARFGIKAVPEYPVTVGKKHYRIDLAIFCVNGAIAIECDNHKAHSSPVQKKKDRQKDLALRKLNFQVFRLTESQMLERLDESVERIRGTVEELGGIQKGEMGEKGKIPPPACAGRPRGRISADCDLY